VTVPGVLGVTHWFVVAMRVVAWVELFSWFEKKGILDLRNGTEERKLMHVSILIHAMSFPWYP
jgi:hypothetical protein